MNSNHPLPLSLGSFEILKNRSETVERVYLDFNATTPPAAVLETHLIDWASQWGNPSSIHRSGRGPKALLREARRQWAEALNCDALELIFTGGGSEANNLALKGILPLPAQEKNEIITSSVEHPSVTQTLKYLENWGYKIHWVPVSRSGDLDLDVYKKYLSKNTALVSIMAVNNETGNIFPTAQLCRWAHEVGALFHCDAVQALGKVPLDLKEWDVDLATFSAHKFYALKGLGCLYQRRGLRLNSLIHGGGQERGRRAGTENTLAIAAFGLMANYIKEVVPRSLLLQKMRDDFEEQISKQIDGVTITGHQAPRVASTSSLVIEGVDGETLLMNLDMKGFSVSTGAACSAGNPEPSPVLLAMGLSRLEAQSSLRVSLGWSNTPAELQKFSEVLVQTVKRLRSLSSSGI